MNHTLATLQARGFDLSRKSTGRAYTVKCSQCAACAVNGVPCHERGCPNAVHECHGCNELIPMNRKYCGGCI